MNTFLCGDQCRRFGYLLLRQFVIAWQDDHGNVHEEPMWDDDKKVEAQPEGKVTRIAFDPRI